MKKITLFFMIIFTLATLSFADMEKVESKTSNISINLEKDGLILKNDMKEAIMSFSDSISVDSLYFPEFLN